MRSPARWRDPDALKTSAFILKKRKTIPNSRASWRLWRMSMLTTPLPSPSGSRLGSRGDYLCQRKGRLGSCSSERWNIFTAPLTSPSGRSWPCRRAKVSGKLEALQNMLERVDKMLIGRGHGQYLSQEPGLWRWEPPRSRTTCWRRRRTCCAAPAKKTSKSTCRWM